MELLHANYILFWKFDGGIITAIGYFKKSWVKLNTTFIWQRRVYRTSSNTQIILTYISLDNYAASIHKTQNLSKFDMKSTENPQEKNKKQTTIEYTSMRTYQEQTNRRKAWRQQLKQEICNMLASQNFFQHDIKCCRMSA